SDRPTAFRLARFRGEPQKGTRWARRGGERRPRTSTAPGRPAGLRPRSHAFTRRSRRRADPHGSVAAHPEKLLRAASRHGMWTFSSSMMKPHSFGGATQLIALYQNCLV